MNYNFIETLKDNNNITYSNSKDILKITTNYYQNFYDIKIFDEKIKKQTLNYITKRISSRTISRLKKLISLRKIKIVIRRTALKSLFKKNDLFNEYYKTLI